MTGILALYKGKVFNQPVAGYEKSFSIIALAKTFVIYLFDSAFANEDACEKAFRDLADIYIPGGYSWIVVGPSARRRTIVNLISDYLYNESQILGRSIESVSLKRALDKAVRNDVAALPGRGGKRLSITFEEIVAGSQIAGGAEEENMSKAMNYWNLDMFRRILLHILVLQKDPPGQDVDMIGVLAARLGHTKTYLQGQVESLYVDGVLDHNEKLGFTKDAFAEIEGMANSTYHLDQVVRFGSKQEINGNKLISAAYDGRLGQRFHEIIVGAIEHLAPRLTVKRNIYSGGSLHISGLEYLGKWGIVLLTHPKHAPMEETDLAMANLYRNKTADLFKLARTKVIDIMCGPSFKQNLNYDASDNEIFLMDVFSFLELHYYLTTVTKDIVAVQERFPSFFHLGGEKKGGYVSISAGRAVMNSILKDQS